MGDDRTVEEGGRILDADRGAVMLDAAVRSGDTVAVLELIARGAVATRAGADGVDPVASAADLGAFAIVNCLSADRPWMPRAGDAEQRAFRAARPWLTLDPEEELRRRLGGEAVTVRRERVVVPDEFGNTGLMPHATRIRAIAADGRRAEVYTAHRAIVTDVEGHLGVVIARASSVRPDSGPGRPQR